MNKTVGAEQTLNLNDLLNGKFLDNDRLNQKLIIQKVENILQGWRNTLAEDGDSPHKNDSTVEEIPTILAGNADLDPLQTVSVERPRDKQRTSRWAHSVPCFRQPTDVVASAAVQNGGVYPEPETSDEKHSSAELSAAQKSSAPPRDTNEQEGNQPHKLKERPVSRKPYAPPDTGNDKTKVKPANVRRSRPPRKICGNDVQEPVTRVETGDGRRPTDGPIKPKQRWRSGGHQPPGVITAAKTAPDNSQKRPFTGAIAAKHLWNILNNVNAENNRLVVPPPQTDVLAARNPRPWADNGRAEGNHTGGSSSCTGPCSSDQRCCDLTGCYGPKEKKDVEVQHPPLSAENGPRNGLREIVASPKKDNTDITTVVGDSVDHDEHGDHNDVASSTAFKLGGHRGETSHYTGACVTAGDDLPLKSPNDQVDIYECCSKIGPETALQVLRSPQVVVPRAPLTRFERFLPPIRGGSTASDEPATATTAGATGHREPVDPAPDYASLYYGDPSPPVSGNDESETLSTRPKISTGIDVTEDVMAIGKHLPALEYTWEGKIDRFFSSRLVGKGGWNIKSFTQTSGADIQIGRLTDEKDRHAILISGTHLQIIKALELVTRQFPDLDLSIEFEFHELAASPRSKQLYLPYCFPVIVKVHSVVSSDQVSIQPRFINDHYWRLKLETSLQAAYSQGDRSRQTDIPMNLALLHHTYSCWTGPNTISLTDVYSEPFSDLPALHIPLLTPVKNGMVCAVKVGLMWCRAIVVRESESGSDIRVRLVDYGGEITATENQLKHLRIDFHGLPFLCIDVSLKGLRLNKNQQMETLVRNCVKIGETYVCVVRGFDLNAKPLVDLFKFGGKKVGITMCRPV